MCPSLFSSDQCKKTTWFAHFSMFFLIMPSDCGLPGFVRVFVYTKFILGTFCFPTLIPDRHVKWLVHQKRSKCFKSIVSTVFALELFIGMTSNHFLKLQHTRSKYQVLLVFDQGPIIFIVTLSNENPTFYCFWCFVLPKRLLSRGTGITCLIRWSAVFLA